MQRIAIIGLGLIGGSLGLALKKSRISGLEVVGYNRRPEAASRARERGAVDKVDPNLASAVRDADMVIIAVPVLAVRPIMEAIAPYLPAGCVVTDVASTKALVMEWAKELLPSTVSFVGGHPMAGKETPGIDGADADLFHKATYCIVPSSTAEPKAVDSVLGLVQSVGATPFFVDAAEHDGFVAGISHLPLVLSTALVLSTTNSPSWREMSRLASSGYRDVTRLASGDPTMGHDICVSNRESICRWIDVLIADLQRFKGLIDVGGEDLVDEFSRAQSARNNWLKGPEESGSSAQGVDGSGEGMMGMFLGRHLAKATSPGPKPGGNRGKK